MWGQEDFSFQEHDRAADTTGTVSKKGGSSKVKRVVKKKVKNIDCIDLSSDEDDDEVVEEYVDDSEDEVEFLAEMEGHFFGEESAELSDVEENDAEGEVDPFADIIEVAVEVDEEEEGGGGEIEILG